MNEDSYHSAEKLVPATYLKQGKDAKKTHEKHIQALLYHVRDFYKINKLLCNAIN